MSADSRQIVVLSANEQTYYRVARLCSGSHLSSVQWLSDPIQFSSMLNASTSTAQYHTRTMQYVGVAVDLTAPESPPPNTPMKPAAKQTETPKLRELELAWSISSLIAATINVPRLPLLLISANSHLEEILRQHGAPLIERLSLRDDDLIWHRALVRLVTDSRIEMSPAADEGKLQTSRGHASVGRVRLSGDVWFDADECALLVAGKVVLLTARETHIMTRLIRAPRHFHSSAELARLLTRPGAFPVSEHSVEQTMSGLRRKLGEARGKPGILVSRRGLGYAIGSVGVDSVEMDSAGMPGMRSAMETRESIQ